jgi:hypothetical protein
MTHKQTSKKLQRQREKALKREAKRAKRKQLKRPIPCEGGQPDKRVPEPT